MCPISRATRAKFHQLALRCHIAAATAPAQGHGRTPIAQRLAVSFDGLLPRDLSDASDLSVKEERPRMLRMPTSASPENYIFGCRGTNR
jgi:hypothetical protein